MSGYVDLLESNPTPYRIFYNFLKEGWQNLGVRFVKTNVNVIFWRKNTKVFMHFDIDYLIFFIFISTEKNSVFYFIPAKLNIYIKFHIH